MSQIQIQGLTKRFGNLVAVSNIHLDVPKGTIFGFLGPNGSGKSTTVKMLTGLLQPDSGDALICGTSIVKAALEVKKMIGALPEDLALFDSVTIWEHLMIAGAAYELDKTETQKRAERLLDYLDLKSARNTYVDQASTGMRKKCALAMALIHNPQILFLDEPFEGIDPVSSRNIKDLLILIARNGGTVFITSHILEVVERLVESFAIIVSGEIVCTKTVAEVLSTGQTLEDLFFEYVRRPPVEALQWVG
jgi:ABC-2 type transport system ATP-binding protein